jgi:hypothetical protein
LNPEASSKTMSLTLAVLVALVAWRLGPHILRCVGQLLMIIVIAVVCVAPAHAQPDTTAGIVTAVVGAAAYQTGTAWRRRRRYHRVSAPAPTGRSWIRGTRWQGHTSTDGVTPNT